ncbi:hypothetical protein [Dapis sp. BLCC M172]|uniref:hypothetical protein n=1 Tax=Dapis sp. BLCC M172 TaxID=2975281 RepID=UPI003CF6FC2A
MMGSKCDFTQIKVGDNLSEVQYYSVTKVLEDELELTNERGYQITVAKGIVEEGMYFAQQYEKEQKVSRTELCELLESAGDTVFTVNFRKKIKEEDVLEAVLSTLKGQELTSPQAQKQLKASVKQALQGEERTLVGYLLQTEPKMGRSQVIDLEAEGEHRTRLVDHRTINWLILKNIKYLQK